jgi:hypothetical protein
MASAAVLPVPNRIKRAALFALCLIAAQMLIVQSSCTLEPLPMAARAAH